ncbi:hypothetical protein BGZ76_006012 [Entomortierella beljakovae]|nr:hypothetical protein BGZ76_006012 [Entomortierella beljakovae]
MPKKMIQDTISLSRVMPSFQPTGILEGRSYQAMPSEVSIAFSEYSSGAACNVDSKGVVTIASNICTRAGESVVGDCTIQWNPVTSQNALVDLIGSGEWTLLETSSKPFYWSYSDLASVNDQLVGLSVENNSLPILNYTVFDKSYLRFRDQSRLMNLESLKGWVGAVSYPGNDKLYIAGNNSNGTYLATTPLNSTAFQSSTYDSSPNFQVDYIPANPFQACGTGERMEIKAMSVIGQSIYVICSKGYEESSRVVTIYRHDGINWVTPIKIILVPWEGDFNYEFINFASGQPWVLVSRQKQLGDNRAYSIEFFSDNTAV